MLFALTHLNYVAVLVVTIIGFIFGWIWFSLLFGKICKAEMKCDVPEGEKPNMGAQVVKSLIVTFISSVGLAVLIQPHGNFSPRHGAEFGAVVGLLVVGARFLNDAVWSKAPCRLTAVKVGHEVLLFAIQAAILGIWPS